MRSIWGLRIVTASVTMSVRVPISLVCALTSTVANEDTSNSDDKTGSSEDMEGKRPSEAGTWFLNNLQRIRC